MKSRAATLDTDRGVAKFHAEMDEPLLEAVLGYWQSLRGAREMPRRQDIDPVALPRPSLPHLFLMRVDCHCLRYSLVGTAIELQFGMSIAGQVLHDVLFGSEEDSIFSQYQETVETHRPTYCQHDFIDTRRLPLQFRRLLLPLSADGATVTDLFGVCVFRPQSGGRFRRW